MTDQAPMTDEQAIERLDALVSRAFLENDADSHMRAAIQHLRDRLRASAEPVKRDREVDRGRFPDPAFNRWLDEGISDGGHTVYDALVDIADAWSGWSARPDCEQITACCGRRECGGECGNEWRGMVAAPPRAPVAEGIERAAEVPAVDERGWLLERGPASNPQYVTVTAGVIDWTAPSDHAHALRFARRADAEMLATIVDDADRIAEHSWHDCLAAKLPTDSESDLYDRVFSAVTKATPTFVDPMDNSLVRRLGLSEREAMARAVLSALSRPAAEVKP